MNSFFYDYKFSASNPFHLYHSIMPPFERKQQCPDIHEALHLGILLRGTMNGVFGRDFCSFREGDCYMTGCWEPHCCHGSADGYELLLITVDPRELSRFFLAENEKIRQLISLPSSLRQPLLRQGRIRAAAMTYGRSIRQMMQHSPDQLRVRKWHAVIGLMIEICSCISSDSIPENSPSEYTRLLPAIQRLSSEAAVRIGVEDAAAACGLSVSRFSHLFRCFFGIPFGTYELQYRLSHAANDLYSRDQTIKDIAFERGFHDESHFVKSFKKYFGLTPGDYRKELPRSKENHFQR